jgi:hypothetical protein
MAAVTLDRFLTDADLEDALLLGTHRVMYTARLCLADDD